MDGRTVLFDTWIFVSYIVWCGAVRCGALWRGADFCIRLSSYTLGRGAFVPYATAYGVVLFGEKAPHCTARNKRTVKPLLFVWSRTTSAMCMR